MTRQKYDKISCSKKLLFAVLFLCLFILSSFSSEKTKIRVGIYDSNSYYQSNFTDNKNTYGYAYLAEIESLVPVIFEYVHGTWEECLEMLQNGEIDLLDSAQHTFERTEFFNYSKLSTGVSHTKIITRADEDNLNFNDFASFDGMTLGVQAGSNIKNGFLNFAKKNNFAMITKEYASSSALTNALNSNEVDAILTASLAEIDSKLLARFDSFPFYMMTNKNNPEITALINDALELIQFENPLFSYDLYKKYYGYELEFLLLSQAEQEYIENHKPITVVYDSDCPPFESYNEEKKIPEGINIEIFFRILEKTGLKINLLHGYTYEQAIVAVSDKKADMLLSYSANRKEAKELDIVLSKTYLSTPIGIAGRSTIIAEDAIFAIPKIYTLHYEFIKKHFPDNEIKIYETMADCYESIEMGESDFTMDNMYAITDTLKSSKYPHLVFSLVTTLHDNLKFAFKDTIDPILVSIFNKAITSVTNTDLERMLIEFSTKQTANITFGQFIKAYEEIIFFIGIIIGFIIIAIVVLNINKYRVRKEMFYEISYIDALTKIGNLNKFKLDTARILKNNPDKKYTIVKIDINCFNLVNDMYGFKTGDIVLCTIAEEIKKIATTLGGVVARIGADDFCFLVESEDEFGSTEKKYLPHNLKNIINEKTGCALQFIIGRHFIDSDEVDVNLIFEKANYAHNVAKKNRDVSKIFDYDKNMQQKALRDRKMENKMASALEDEDFVVFLQAKFSLDAEKIVGAEALVRWLWQTEGEITFVSPGEFIPLFERNGYIVHLDMYMFKQVCRIISAWIAERIPVIPVSVNFSRFHLRNENFVQTLVEIADRYNIPRYFLEIELTESAFIDTEDVIEKVLVQLHEAGFKLSMDDFGAGYSSLGLLKNLPVDVIKIDRNFFKDAKNNTNAEIVIRKVMEMAKELGIVTVAEGVETMEHIEFLRTVNCDIVQGFYYARPIHEEEFTKERRKEIK